jgi:hypothetical protein
VRPAAADADGETARRRVTADSPERAAQIAWLGGEPGETIEYAQEMECLDPDGPEVVEVYELVSDMA